MDKKYKEPSQAPLFLHITIQNHYIALSSRFLLSFEKTNTPEQKEIFSNSIAEKYGLSRSKTG